MTDKYNSFIYLVARRGLHAPSKHNPHIPASKYYPVVLMVKENNGLWGMPGGKSEQKDLVDANQKPAIDKAYNTARREFFEEIGRDVALLTKNTCKVTIRDTQHSKHVCILFDGWAEHVEKVFNIPHRHVDNVKKSNIRLSKEVAGYAWVSVNILGTAHRHKNQVLLSSEAHPTDRGMPVKLRGDYVCEPTTIQSILSMC